MGWQSADAAWYTVALLLMMVEVVLFALLTLPPSTAAAAAAAMMRALTVSTGMISAKASEAKATPVMSWKNPVA
jgi:hypothetical protein